MNKKNEFEKNSLIVFCLMMVANICNYLFQIIVGNLLNIEDFGVVNAIIALFGILSIPTTIITMVSARYFAIIYAENKYDSLSTILKILSIFAVGVSALLAIGGITGYKKIAEIFNISTQSYIIAICGVAIINIFYSVTAGVLQGIKRFTAFGIQNVMLAAGKVVISIVLLLLGMKIYGVILGILSGILLALLYGIFVIKRETKGLKVQKDDKIIEIREFVRYTIIVIMSQGGIIALTNGDVLLVKAYFNDIQAGEYSSAMVIGKIAMYVATAIVATLFPMVVEQFQKGNDTMPLLRKAMIYGGGAAVLCSAGMIAFGEVIVKILFGERYLSAITYLPYICAFVVPVTLLTILMNYVMAINKALFFGTSIISSLLIIIGLTYVFHDTIAEMLLVVGGVLLCNFVINLIWIIIYNKHNTVKN